MPVYVCGEAETKYVNKKPLIVLIKTAAVAKYTLAEW